MRKVFQISYHVLRAFVLLGVPFLAGQYVFGAGAQGRAVYAALSPLVTAGLIQAGTTAAGWAADKYLNEDPDVPDYSADVLAQYEREAQRLDNALRRRQNQLEADLAATGATGSAGAAQRGQLYESANNAQLDLAAKRADAVTAAENREKALRHQRQMRESQARSQGISDLVGGVGNLASMYAFNNVGSGSGGNALPLSRMRDYHRAKDYMKGAIDQTRPSDVGLGGPSYDPLQGAFE